MSFRLLEGNKQDVPWCSEISKQLCGAQHLPARNPPLYLHQHVQYGHWIPWPARDLDTGDSYLYWLCRDILCKFPRLLKWAILSSVASSLLKCFWSWQPMVLFDTSVMVSMYSMALSCVLGKRKVGKYPPFMVMCLGPWSCITASCTGWPRRAPGSLSSGPSGSSEFSNLSDFSQI